jgi:hypothetical protein
LENIAVLADWYFHLRLNHERLNLEHLKTLSVKLGIAQTLFLAEALIGHGYFELAV